MPSSYMLHLDGDTQNIDTYMQRISSTLTRDEYVAIVGISWNGQSGNHHPVADRRRRVGEALIAPEWTKKRQSS